MAASPVLLPPIHFFSPSPSFLVSITPPTPLLLIVPLSLSHSRWSKLTKVFTLLFPSLNGIHTLTRGHTQTHTSSYRCLHTPADIMASSVFLSESISTNSSTAITHTHMHEQTFTVNTEQNQTLKHIQQQQTQKPRQHPHFTVSKYSPTAMVDLWESHI